MKSPWVWAVHEPRIRMLEQISADVSSANLTFARSSHVSSANATFALSANVSSADATFAFSSHVSSGFATFARSVDVASAYLPAAGLDIWGGISPASHQLTDTARWCVYSGTACTTATIVMPNSPFDRQEVWLSTKAAITTVIHSTGNAVQTIFQPISTLATGVGVAGKVWVWSQAYLTWFRVL